MSTEAVRDFLDRSKAGWQLVERLIAEKVVKEVAYPGRSYILKTLSVKR